MPLDDVPSPHPPPLRFVMELRVEVGPPVELGENFGNARRFVPITGGSFNGPKIQGAVLAGGADWQYTRPDGATVLEARYALRSDAGALISVVNRGVRHGAPGFAAMIAAGRHVPPSQYYFMTAPLFESSAPELAWLSRTLFIGQAEREVDCVLVRVWQVGDGVNI